MVCPNDIQARQQLEALYRKPAAMPLRARFAEFLRQIGKALVIELTRDRNEPRISKYDTAEGQAIWHVYDPLTQQRAVFDAEVEVYAWLEQRYNQ